MFTRRALFIVSSVLFVGCSSSTPHVDGETAAPKSDGTQANGDSAPPKSNGAQANGDSAPPKSGAICEGDTTRDSETTVYNKDKYPKKMLTVDSEDYKITCSCYMGGGDPGQAGIVSVIRLQDKHEVAEFFMQNGVVGRRKVRFKDKDGIPVTANVDLNNLHAAWEKAGGTCYDIHPGLKTYDFAPS